jgi:hypothetical protein
MATEAVDVECGARRVKIRKLFIENNALAHEKDSPNAPSIRKSSR